MRIWFNKTFSTIRSVFENLRRALPLDEATIVCTHIHAAATAFLAADEAYLEPEITGPEYLQWCLEFCAKQHIDLFWPGKEAILIGQNSALFEGKGVQVVAVADSATLNLLHNKAHFYAQLPENVARVMDFRTANNRDDFDRAVHALSRKYSTVCVKPAVSVYGLGFRILDADRDSITQLLKGVEYQIPLQELRQGMQNTPQFDTLLVMEHLGGSEWSVDCAGRNGELLAAVQRKKSQLAGHGQTIDNQPEIAGMVTRLTAHYRLNGIFNIQFKKGDSGIRLLEINPRPSGGFGMACLAGANLAHIALQGLRGEAVVKPLIHYGMRVNEVNTPVIIKGL